MVASKGLDKRMLTGGIVSLIGGLIALIGDLLIFLQSYGELKIGYKEASNLPGVTIVTYILPAMSDIIMIAGLLLIIATFGYFMKKKWAWFVSVLGAVLGLLGTWMAFVWPLMIAYTPRYAPIFVTFLVVWVVLLVYVKPVGTKLFLLSTFAGIAMVLNFMNGVASFNKMLGAAMLGQPNGIFVATQQLNWIAAFMWGIFTVAVLYRRPWALIMGIGAGILPLISGTPLAYLNSVQTGEFSLFWIGIGVSLAYLLVILFKGEKLWTDGGQAEVEHEQSVTA